jgi:hypothetical protein
MTKRIRLTDIQLVLLASAAARGNGSLLPPPETLEQGPARIRKAVEQLIRRSLAAEVDRPDGADVWRTDDDRAISVIITDQGRAAINLGDDSAASISSHMPVTPLATLPAPTKTAHVLALLGREEGATLGELVDATGWLPHTTRAALTGMRKKGHAIERDKRGEVSCYYLAAAMAAAA